MSGYQTITINPLDDIRRIMSILKEIFTFNFDFEPENFAKMIKRRRNKAYWAVQVGGRKSRKIKKHKRRFRKTRNK
jgi:hypothetical protein|tara:strand:- start:313 stop:540 length:228 start_codon:yes stop_codon:yes gene_type:complete